MPASPLYLFTCGIASVEEEREFLSANLPEQLKRFTEGLHHLGGELREDKFFQRMVLEDYRKKSGVIPALDEGAIADLAAALKAQL